MATQPSYLPEPAPVTTADELAVIIQRAQTFTNASGAATAIREANTSEIICRARSGASAPDVGTVLRIEGTFTGMCIRNGEGLICDDAQIDSRVDTSAIRALGVRSIAVVPVKEDGRVIGVLAAFAPAACAFSALHVAILNALADQISMLLRKERCSKTGRYIEPLVSRPDSSAEANQAATAATVSPILVPEQIERHEEKPAESTLFDGESRIRELRVAYASRLGIDTTGGTSKKRTNSIPKKLMTGAIAAVLVAAFVIVVLLKIGSRRSETPAPSVSRENSSVVQAESNQNASHPGPALSRSGSKTKSSKVATGSKSQSKSNQKPGEGKPVPVPSAAVTPSDPKATVPVPFAAPTPSDPKTTQSSPDHNP